MRKVLLAGCFITLCCILCSAQQKHDAAPSPTLNLKAAAASAGVSLTDSSGSGWSQVAAVRVGLNRTPNLYDTDPPSTLDIPFVEVRTVRLPGKIVIHLSWKDSTQDVAKLELVPSGPPETRFHKALVDSTDRFFDAAAVMVPVSAPVGGFSPSLQMGDVNDPVRIFYWNAVRGAMLMEAQGRGTTKRTGQTFPAQGSYQSGQWSVVFELPDLPTGTPVAFGIWNGSQQDRDGRKYFSVWHVLE